MRRLREGLGNPPFLCSFSETQRSCTVLPELQVKAAGILSPAAINQVLNPFAPPLRHTRTQLFVGKTTEGFTHSNHLAEQTLSKVIDNANWLVTCC